MTSEDIDRELIAEFLTILPHAKRIQLLICEIFLSNI